MDTTQLLLGRRTTSTTIWLAIVILLCLAQTSLQQQALRRRRPLDYQHAVTAHPLGDQIALANTWHAPNRVISATYAGNLDTGHVSQANVVVNVLPTSQRSAARLTDADLANAESLANTRTAAEYVTKAMQMRGTKHQLKAPQSSYIKYDVFASQEAKVFGSPAPPRPRDSDSDDDSGEETDDDEEPQDIGTTEASRFVMSEQVTSHQQQLQRPTVAAPQRLKQTPLRSSIGQTSYNYNHNPYTNHSSSPALADLSPTTRSSKQYEEQYEYNPRKPDYGTPHLMREPKPQLYNSYGTPYGSNSDDEPYPRESYYPPPPAPTELPKSEMIKHIQHSVLKYMKELEAAGRFTTTTTTTTTTTPAPPPPSLPPVEIKTYYRIPAHQSSSISSYGQMGRGKSTYPRATTTAAPSLPMDYYRTPSSSSIDDSYFPSSYTTPSSAENYPATTMSTITYHSVSDSGSVSTPHIDLTFRSKSRPKPIDLAALDVGQSWSHDSDSHSGLSASPSPSLPPPRETVYYRYPASATPEGKHSKPLHFSSQTYHDINSMTYVPGKGSSSSMSATVSMAADMEQTPVRFKDEPSAVVTYQEPASADELLHDVQQHYRTPIHIINGIPVANPYKFNVEQLKQMFGSSNDDVREHRGYGEEDIGGGGVEDSPLRDSGGWQPSFNPEPSYTKPRPPKTHHKGASSTHHHNMPYESYTSNRYKQQQQQQQQYQSGDSDDDSGYGGGGGEEWQAAGNSYGGGGGGGSGGSYRSPSEMYSSSSGSHRPKKHKNNGSSSSSSSSSHSGNGDKKRQKKRRPASSTASSAHKGKKRGGQKKSRSLETELRPPPAGIIY